MKNQPHKILAKAILPAGFRTAGITAGLKASGQADMALFFSDSPATVAGTFTTNQVKAATVRLPMPAPGRMACGMLKPWPPMPQHNWA